MPQPASNFRRFLGYVKPYWFYVAAAAFGGIVKFSLPLLVPQITRYLIDHVLLNQTMTMDQKVFDLLFWVGGIGLMYVVVWVPLTYVRHYFAGVAGHRSVVDLRSDLFERLLRMSASFYNRNKSGGIVSRLIGDVALAQNLVGSALTNIWMDLIALAVTIIFLLQIDLNLTLVALATFPFYLFMFRRLGDKIKANSHKVQEEITTIAGSLQEKIAGSRVVHAFNHEETEQERFNRDSDRLLGMTMHGVRLQSWNVTITGLLTGLAPLFVTFYGGWGVIHGSITIGELVAVGMYLNPLYTPLQRFAELNVIFANSMAALDRIFAIMDQPPDIRDREGATHLEKVRGDVRFEDVNFAYADSQTVLQTVNFEAPAGKKIALVGHSGSGKSTVVSLIPRFYDVSAGRVLIDGHDVRDLTIKSLRQNIGMVLQDPILFSGSVAENVRYGDPKASQTRLIEACRAANALDFIEALPEGFGTEVGERGAFLSGGQKQRLTIARAYLKDPRILILDEATSSLDSESERLIQDALDRLMAGRTTFIIAHRLSTIENADQILVLHQGRVAESGVHADLIKAGGHYARLYARQFRDDPA